MNIQSKYLWPTVAVLAGGVGAWVIQPQSAPSTAAYSAAAATPPMQGKQDPASTVHGAANPETDGERLEGKVLETIAVPNYTYLRIAQSGGNAPGSAAEVWAAVATAEVKVGQSVAVVGAQRMEKFTSSTLKRTFETIYFGALEGGAPAKGEAQGAQLPKGHPDIGAGTGDAMNGKLPPGHPDLSTATGAASAASAPGGIDPMLGGQHGSPTAGGDQVEVGKVARASGALGHTVSEVVNDRKQFAGKKVRVRGVVVKSTSGVLGKTFLHLRDGSGKAATGDHDLTATIEQNATVGSTLLLEGTVVTDKDFGAGYTYRVLLEDAKAVGE